MKIHSPYRDHTTALIGQCIYCRSDGGENGLGEEHVFPLALNGRLILNNASCTPCANLIATYEGKVLNGQFRGHRMTSNVPGRRATTDYSKSSLPVILRFADGTTRREAVPIAECPIKVILPVFGALNTNYSLRPQILQPLDHMIAIRQPTYAAKERALLDRFGAVNLEPHFRPDLSAFVRMLAKIAHGLSVGKLGLNGFSPTLLDIILLGSIPRTTDIGCVENTLPRVAVEGYELQWAYKLSSIPVGNTDVTTSHLIVVDLMPVARGPSAPVYSIVAGIGDATTAQRLRESPWPGDDELSPASDNPK